MPVPEDPPELSVAFDWTLDHGRCIGVRIPELEVDVEGLAAAALVSEEREHAAGTPLPRRRAWVGGRAALRTALRRVGVSWPAILPDDRGAPVGPMGWSVSISHKDAIAVALVAREAHARVGVDVERDGVLSPAVCARVLADDERAELAAATPDEIGRSALLRFSAKESVYKALDPFVRRYVAFKEVSVFPSPDGSARVEARLPEGPFEVEVRWRRFGDLVLTTARAMRPRQPRP